MTDVLRELRDKVAARLAGHDEKRPRLYDELTWLFSRDQAFVIFGILHHAAECDRDTLAILDALIQGDKADG